jgi:hypothetical protein
MAASKYHGFISSPADLPEKQGFRASSRKIWTMAHGLLFTRRVASRFDDPYVSSRLGHLRETIVVHGITYPDILGTVGHTPLVWLKRIIPSKHSEVLVKCEFFNPLCSV